MALKFGVDLVKHDSEERFRKRQVKTKYSLTSRILEDRSSVSESTFFLKQIMAGSWLLSVFVYFVKCYYFRAILCLLMKVATRSPKKMEQKCSEWDETCLASLCLLLMIRHLTLFSAVLSGLWKLSFFCVYLSINMKNIPDILILICKIYIWSEVWMQFDALGCWSPWVLFSVVVIILVRKIFFVR